MYSQKSSLEEELHSNRLRIKETSKALAIAQGKEKEALEILMDSLMDNEDDILKEIDILTANSHA